MPTNSVITADELATDASHFIMCSGNLLTLKEILGRTDIKMAMRYTHLIPQHLEDAIIKNPLSDLTVPTKCQPGVNADE